MGRMSTDSAKPAVAVSACLLGEECTWRGGHNALPADAIARLREACELVPICPEVQGGLPTPRPPSEIVNARPASGEGVRGTVRSYALADEDFCSADEGEALEDACLRVLTNEGKDVTAQFRAGALAALADARAAGCRFALLKEKSPSCGFGRIYDGTFSGVLVEGSGVAARAFANAGIRVFGESAIKELLARL